MALHRYLGVAVGWLMLVWCLSGVVMMFVGYPELAESRRIQGLEPIDAARCCRFDPAVADSEPIAAAQMETVAGVPVLRLGRAAGPDVVTNLLTGRPLATVGADQARAVAADFARGAPLGGHPSPPAAVDRDPWTVSGDFNPDRALWKVSLGDRSGAQVYVSSASGKVVQATTASQRLWNQFGAIPHWLYFQELRRNAALWSQVVIWSALLGCFLMLTGLYVGWTAIRPGRSSTLSPYGGSRLWHHLAGLAFGLLTLAWVASGALSMNPWGLLESGGGELAGKVRGPPPRWAVVRAALVAATASPASSGAASLRLAPLDGRTFILAQSPSGAVVRLDARGAPSPLTLADLQVAASRITSGPPPASEGIIRTGDAYYFRHHAPVRLPAYRVVLRDGTRVYLDPVSGEPLAILDGAARGYRWLHQAPHRWDFIAGLRRGSGWAALVLVLLAGVTAGVATGVWLSLRAVARDVRRLARRLSRPPRPGPGR